MPEKTVAEFQKEQAINCFNRTWEYIELDERTAEEDLEMIHCAHASRYLWGLVGTPVQFERGEWLLAKVYHILGNGERALYHATFCHDIVEENKIGDFDLTFAYEALAKAHHLLGNTEQYEQYKSQALTSLDNIKDEGDLAYAKAEVEKL